MTTKSARSNRADSRAKLQLTKAPIAIVLTIDYVMW